LHTSVTIPPGVRKSDTWFWAAGVLRGSWNASAGWGGVCILGAVTALLALGVWAVTEAARGRARRSEARTAVCAGAGD
jgi:hypothetical protein